MNWLDLLAVQGTLKSLLQHSKASIFRCSAFFTVQLSHPYTTTGKTIALTRWTFVGKVMPLLLNMVSRLVITFLPRSKSLSCPTLCDPIDGSPLGSSVPGILQARILEWVAISFSPRITLKGRDGKCNNDLFFWAPKSLQMVTAAMKLKDAYSLEGKL